MIVTETRTLGLITSELSKGNKITIVSCNKCPRICGTGGEEVVKHLRASLEGKGFDVADTFVLAPACNETVTKQVVKDPQGDTIIVLACAAGNATVKRLFPDKKIVTALDTIGIGSYDENGNIYLNKKCG